MLITIRNESSFNIRRDAGIYLIRCIPENKIYIGCTKQSFRARFSNHCKFLIQGKLANKNLQKDFNHYGADKFEFEILEVCKPQDAVLREQYYIDTMIPYYNVLKASNNSKTNLNRKFSENHKEKIRQKALLYKHDNAAKEILSALNKENAAKYEIANIETQEKRIVTYFEMCTFFQTSITSRSLNKVFRKTWIITKLKKQAKSIYLFINNEWIEFQSYEKCDKFLNKWRGYTSTQMLKGCDELNGYKVKTKI